jgi:hypothetical protein
MSVAVTPAYGRAWSDEECAEELDWNEKQECAEELDWNEKQSVSSSMHFDTTQKSDG